MSEDRSPDTPAVQVLQAASVAFTDHFYTYQERGTTADWARELNIDEHAIVKTILLEADGKPFIVLMHGDMRASIRELASITGAKSVTPCFPDKQERYTGYQAGGISPFGTVTEVPVYMEETILNLRKIYINGGKRGYLIGLDPYELVRILSPITVRVGATRTT